jgi:hypothetical protein
MIVELWGREFPLDQPAIEWRVERVITRHREIKKYRPDGDFHKPKRP